MTDDTDLGDEYDRTGWPFPDDVPVLPFTDERIQLSHWFPKIRKIDVPAPTSMEIDLVETGDGMPEWDSEEIRGFVSSWWNSNDDPTFVRSEYKHANVDFAGSKIPSDPSTDEIDQTVKELLAQHAMMEIPHGDSIWLREWLDLEWVKYGHGTMHPEIRVFIEDGDVLCHHQRTEIPERFDSIEPELELAIDAGWDYHVEEYAQTVADEFDGSWSVDFVCTTDREWYCTDMAPRALTHRGGRWGGLSGHPVDEHDEMCAHDLEHHIDLDAVDNPEMYDRLMDA